MKSLPIIAALCLLSACAAVRPDHYYVLSAQPPGAVDTRLEPTTQVSLRVSLPSLVDRSEMVLNSTPDAVTVLEHERWAAPLADLIAGALAQNLERRRADLLIAGQSLNLPGAAAVTVWIDLTQVWVRRGQQASMDVQWRIRDARSGQDQVGGETFSAPLAEDGYASVARALSDCLGALADRLVAQLPPRQER